MLRRISTPPTPVNYAEVAGHIDFPGLQRDIRAAARLTFATIGLSLGTMMGLLGVVLLLDLHGWSFYLTCAAAAGISFAFAILGTLGLAKYKPTWASLDAVVHEEWKTGVRVLPPWFTIPKMYAKFRVVPELNEAKLRKLRRARLILSDKFQITAYTIIFVGTLLGIVLAVQGLKGLVLALPVLIPGLVIVVVAACARRGIRLLAWIREFERVTGRTILPPDLASEGRRTRG